MITKKGRTLNCVNKFQQLTLYERTDMYELKRSILIFVSETEGIKLLWKTICRKKEYYNDAEIQFLGTTWSFSCLRYHQQTKIQITFVSLQTLCLTGNVVYLIQMTPKAKSTLIPLFLIHVFFLSYSVFLILLMLSAFWPILQFSEPLGTETAISWSVKQNLCHLNHLL